MLRLAARSDREAAVALFEYAKQGFTVVLPAIGESPFAIELVRANPTMPPRVLEAILSARCDAKRRADVAAMTELAPTVQRTVIAQLDACLARHQPFDPVFRRWLAPKPTRTTR